MTRSAGLRPASRGSAKPAPTTLGAPVSDRHRAGARNQRRQRLERRSPTGIARERETSADNAWSAGQFSRWGPPTGIARERETSADNAWSAGLRPASRGSAKPAPTTLGAPASSPGGGLRPASRGSAKPAPTTLGAPVSDRHRAGARNQRRQRLERRSPTGIARERETSADNAWSAGLRPASRGSAKPAPTTLGAPVSDRHRAGARNQRRQRLERRPVLPERRSPTGIAAREGRETTHRQPAGVAQLYLSPGGPVLGLA